MGRLSLPWLILLLIVAGDARTGSAQQTNRQTLRVLSYNIHHAEGVDGKLDLSRIAAVIRSAEPDLVALQEVDRVVRRSGSVDQVARLAESLGMQAAFGQNISLQGGHYGNAILSRFPIVEHRNRLLPNLEQGEQRGVIDALIRLPYRTDPIRFLATHFDHRRDPAERVASAHAIHQWFRESPNQLALLAGDLNAVADSEPIANLLQQWTNSNVAPLPTIPVAKPQRQIDYVLYRPADRWEVVDVRVLEESVASDHRPILAILQPLENDAPANE